MRAYMMLLQSTDYLNFNLNEELLDDEIHSVTTDSTMTPTRKPLMTDHPTLIRPWTGAC